MLLLIGPRPALLSWLQKLERLVLSRLEGDVEIMSVVDTDRSALAENCDAVADIKETLDTLVLLLQSQHDKGASTHVPAQQSVLPVPDSVVVSPGEAPDPPPPAQPATLLPGGVAAPVPPATTPPGKVELPLFDGSDPRAWLSDQFFYIYLAPMTVRVVFFVTTSDTLYWLQRVLCFLIFHGSNSQKDC